MYNFSFDANAYKKQIDKEFTFKGLREKAGEIATEVLNTRKRVKEEYNELLAANKYHPDYIKKKKAELDLQSEIAARDGVAKLENAAKNIIETKREAVKKMLSTAPTQEQLNLLQSLQMQGDSLTTAEIEAILPSLAENYRALKTMETIARKSGYKLTLPAQYDYEELNGSIDAVERYINERISDLLKDKSEWRLDSDCFFGPAEYPDNRYNVFADILDGNIQTVPAIEPIKELAKEEKNALDNLFAGKEGDELAKAVQEASKSPALAELISHSEYAEHVNTSAE